MQREERGGGGEMQNRSMDTGQHFKKKKKKMKKAEQRCRETKRVEEQSLTEKRMIKCSLKQANAFTAGRRDRQSHVCTRSVKWTEDERIKEDLLLILCSLSLNRFPPVCTILCLQLRLMQPNILENIPQRGISFFIVNLDFPLY